MRSPLGLTYFIFPITRLRNAAGPHDLSGHLQDSWDPYVFLSLTKPSSSASVTPILSAFRAWLRAGPGWGTNASVEVLVGSAHSPLGKSVLSGRERWGGVCFESHFRQTLRYSDVKDPETQPPVVLKPAAWRRGKRFRTLRRTAGKVGEALTCSRVDGTLDFGGGAQDPEMRVTSPVRILGVVEGHAQFEGQT